MNQIIILQKNPIFIFFFLSNFHLEYDFSNVYLEKIYQNF